MANWMWQLVIMFLFGVAIGTVKAWGDIAEMWDTYTCKSWAKRWNDHAIDTGLPAATHMKKRWGRIMELWCVDEEGNVLWNAGVKGG